MAIIAVQFLEHVPGASPVSPADACAKLRAAFGLLPISHVLLGWNLPAPLIDACRAEAAQAGAQLYLWHPLLTGDGVFVPQSEWRTVGLQSEPVPAFKDIAEFTFVCPNRRAVRTAVLDHLHRLVTRGAYDGVFLDRIRYPSPAADPARRLACFCTDCHRAAAADGLNLQDAQRSIKQLLAEPKQILSFLCASLGPDSIEPSDPDITLLRAFFEFRERSVTTFVQAAADVLHAEGLAVGLDCFTPALARLVGQDLGALDACAEWTKVMVYGHTLGPAGLPFELLGLVNWLTRNAGISEREALRWLSRATELRLPASNDQLRALGLAPTALRAEVERGRAAGAKKLLAGVELVEMAGVAQLQREQIEADLREFRAAGADGLVLSWDLWHIPLERLKIVSRIWTR
jgi:hypothetical protein